MGLSIGEGRYKRRQIKEVRWEVQCAVGCDRSGNYDVNKEKLLMCGTAHLHAGGEIPPVNIVAYGKATPATCPSTSRRISRNGPWLRESPAGVNSLGVLKY